MIDLTDYIKVIVIRSAAGARPGPVGAGCGPSSATYYAAGRLSMTEPSACGNYQELYDLSNPHKVINIMNFCGAPSSEFFPFNRSDPINILDLQCELDSGDELVCIWKPLYALSPNLWYIGLNTILPDSTS